jgi:transposase
MDAVLGIDIGKAKFHVTVLFSDGTRRRKACANSPAGCSELLAWLARHGAARVHACLEATGTYGELVATTLVDAGHQVSILNPAIIHHTPRVGCCARKPIRSTRTSSPTMRRRNTHPSGRPCRGKFASSKPWSAASTRCSGCRPTNATASRLAR